MNSEWPLWLKAFYVVACVAMTVTVLILISAFVAAPVSEWVWSFTRGWSASGKLGLIVALIVACYALGFYLHRRDQRKADRATL